MNLSVQLFAAKPAGPPARTAVELANTRWENKTGQKCTDRLRFRPGHKVMTYSCELGKESAGTYQQVGDTLTIRSVERRYKLVVRAGRLKPVSSEELVHGKWKLVQEGFDAKFDFVRARPSDEEVFAMLRGFYTKYIRTLNKYPTDERKLQPLLKANCDAKLLARLDDKKWSGSLDYDPFLKAQDVELEWIRSLEVKRVPNKDLYAVSFSETPDRIVVHLAVKEINGVLKIKDVVLD
ncbi:MAG TPA: DUF3828 domain-containing protein [Puia sp.]|uniref:DUF3828 domain-containing protein n=1 Tax=Puia sp. TaxID=2045100 RepID=UPI002BCD0E9F|nr:DUF3828 domain-containing protein [Puia sp.]HVU95364.1 DUF3828 domain-containing protein [Puia sp.]